MWKKVLAGTTALAIAGGSLAYAQQRPAPPDVQRWRPSAEDISALTDARIAGLKAALKLNPEQEKSWPAFEQAIRDLAKERSDRMAARRDHARPADPIERLQSRATAMTDAAANLKRLAEAAKPLYQTLDEGQKHRFAFLIRTVGPSRMAFDRSREHEQHERRGPVGTP